jgi:iron complex outermembrane receptor protein
MSQPAYAESVAITGIQLRPSSSGLDVVLEIPGGATPRFFTSQAGDTFIVDIVDTQLRLTSGQSFRRDNPAEGVASIAVTPLDSNSVRVEIVYSAGQVNVQVNPESNALVLTLPGVGVAVQNQTAPDPSTEAGAEQPPQASDESPTAPPEASTPDGAAPETAEDVEVVVTATRTEEAVTDVPRAVTVITREQIRQGSILSNDLSTILGEQVPGFGPPNPEGRTRAQSLRGRPALILIDGIPQNSNTSFGTELSSIDPSAIERIEVIRGPSATFGDGATGGVINIITRTPVEKGIKSNASITLRPDLDNISDEGFGYKFQYGISGREGIVDFTLDASIDVEQAIFDADGNRIPPDGLSSDNRTLNLLAKAGIDISEDQRLQISYNIFNNDFGSEFISDPAILAIPGNQTARALQVGEIDFDDNPEQTVQNLSLTYRNKNVFGSQLDAQIYYRETDLTQVLSDIRGAFPPQLFPDAPRIFQTNLDSREFGTRLQINTPFTDRVSLLWGADYALEENEALFNSIDTVAFDQNREARVIGTPTQTPFYTLETLGFFAQLKWNISDRFIFSGGLRYETINISVNDYTASPFSSRTGSPPQIEGGNVGTDDVVFNAGLVYKATPNISLFANFSQGFSIPNLDSVLGFLPAGTSIENSFDLEAQKVNNYELGISGNWKRIQVSLAGFFNESELGSALVIDPNVGTQVVRAPQRNYGLEFTADWRPTDRWRLGTILTFNEGDFDRGDDGEFEALSSVNVQPLTLTLYVENETLPGWRNRIQALIVGDRSRAFEDRIDQFAVSGYTLVNFISAINLGKGGRLELGIENLFDTAFLPVSSQERIGTNETRRFAGQGRTLSLRYAIDF